MVEKHVAAIAGNPNVGKSTIFNALTGMKQHTGNWPGKTVSNASGSCFTKAHAYTLVDIPGTYSLIAHSEEEKVASDFIRSGEAEAVIVVCDATCLERNLNLCLQIMAVCSKVIVCVNMMDDAKRKNINIDLQLLSERLGVPVLGVTARKKKTLTAVLEMLDDVIDEKVKCKPLRFSEIINENEKVNDNSDYKQKNYKKENSAGMETEAQTKRQSENANCELYESAEAYVKLAEEVCAGAVGYENSDYNYFDRKLDHVLTSPVTGYPVMLLLLALVFWITVSGANYPSQFLSDIFGILQVKIDSVFSAAGLPHWVHGVVVDGMYKVLTWVIAVMLPPMAIFFPLFTLLEDSGYLPRIAYNLDGVFKKCSACGKQALTMCMGFGCNAAGVTGCRIIDSPRERFLAVLTNSFVPCNGRFPALAAIITMFFVGMGGGIKSSVQGALMLTGTIVAGIIMTFFATALLSKTVLKGVPSSFTLELPPYRRPQIGRVIVSSVFDRTFFVLGRAVVVAAPAGVIIWIMANADINGESLLQICSEFLDPLGKIMGMDGIILLGFILGFPANEIVLPIIMMAYMSQSTLEGTGSLAEMHSVLADNGWTPVTALCVMVFYLMHWPCSTTLLTVKKETGSWKWCGLSAVLPTLCGMVLCMVITICVKIAETIV